VRPLYVMVLMRAIHFTWANGRAKCCAPHSIPKSIEHFVEKSQLTHLTLTLNIGYSLVWADQTSKEDDICVTKNYL
jgi:hypothetical protein